MTAPDAALTPRLYADLAEWWPLLSPPSEYADEAPAYWSLMAGAAAGPIATLLELGSGGGSNAFHLKRRASLTLVDASPDMLAVSRRINPECEHVEGDMRTLRLGRTFDAVFIHDAIMHMLTEADLRAAMRTAAAHLRPGGVALFVPDAVRETWRPEHDTGGHDEPTRALRWLAWSWDPDPRDTEFVTDIALLIREGAALRCEHTRLHMGLFSRPQWLDGLASAGFTARAEPLAPLRGPSDQRLAFVGRRA